MSPIPSQTPESHRPAWDCREVRTTGSCGCQHGGPCTLNPHQLQTEGLNSISIILLCSLGSFLPARWNFAGSTVNVSLFSCLRLQLKWQFGDGLFTGQKHCSPCKQHRLVRFLFIPVTVSMGCWGACAECEPHSSCPPLIPPLAKYKAKD